MLRQLSIRNFVLIDRLDIEFERGMIALTGETGAGKSIVLDALGLALGSRADSASVRIGEKQSDITAEFDLASNAPARAWLASQDEPASEYVVLRRVIDAAGKSRALINGRPASVAELRELGTLLLELHAQHEHQALMRANTQRELLDRFAGAQHEAAAVRDAFAKSTAAHRLLSEARNASEVIARERAVLEAEVAELRDAKPNAEEWTQLSHEQSRLSHAKELLQTAEAARAAIADDEGLTEQLAQLATSLTNAERIDAALIEARQLIESANVQLDEAAQSLRAYVGKLNLDPERLQQTESRISTLFALARKIRARPEALQTHWESAETRLKDLKASQDIAALEKAADEADRVLEAAARALSKKREAAAKKLNKKVTEELPDLAMVNASFAAQLKSLSSIESTGAESIEFAFRSHASLPFAPLAKVASGGELARLSLAILVVCGDAASVPTLVFDEVDVGVGGKVAAQVGRKLQTLADEKLGRQILCVTHMPQVAAHADHHFTVSRDNSASPTTSVNALDKKARVAEVSRMLGGHEIGSATEKLAKELIASSGR